MRLRSLLIVLSLLSIAVFAAVNWPLFNAPANLNLLFADVQAPLGLVMLGILVAVVALFALTLALWQGRFLLESRRMAKELQQLRALAQQAEASRLNELRAALHQEFERLTERLGQVQEALRSDIRDHGNSVAASIAELDDRLAGGRRSD